MNIDNVLIYLALISQIVVLSVLLPLRIHRQACAAALPGNSAAKVPCRHWVWGNAIVAAVGLILLTVLLQRDMPSLALFGYSLLQVGILFLQQRLSGLPLQSVPAQRRASLSRRRLSQFLSSSQITVMLISVVLTFVIIMLMWQQGIWSEERVNIWQLLLFFFFINGVLLTAMFRTLYRKRQGFSRSDQERSEKMQRQIRRYSHAMIMFNCVVILLMQLSLLPNKTAAMYVAISFLLQAILVCRPARG